MGCRSHEFALLGFLNYNLPSLLLAPAKKIKMGFSGAIYNYLSSIILGREWSNKERTVENENETKTRTLIDSQ